MEIIAKKKKSLIYLYAVLAIFGLVISALGIVFYHAFSLRELDGDGLVNLILAIVGGLFIIVVCVFLCFRVTLTAGTITYDGKKIHFRKGLVESPSRIINVEYRKAYFTEKTDAWGSLTVMVGDFVVKYHYVDRVEEVCNRLIELRDKDQKERCKDE